MNHVDLFSGICGFALAAKIVWGDEYNNILFCDNNKFCQEVIKKNFGKDSVIYGDIRLVSREQLNTNSNSNRCTRRDKKINTAERDEQALNNIEECGEFIANTERSRPHTAQDKQKLEGEGGDKFCIEQSGGIDLLTAGVPCQPASQAGKRRGTKDDRWLWPECFRIIRETMPTWCVLENVRGILSLEGGLVFESLLVEMESYGYEVQAFIIPAVAVNAPHRRDRVWFVANCKSSRRLSGLDSSERDKNGGEYVEENRQQRERQRVGVGAVSDDTPNPCGEGLERRSKEGERLPGQQGGTECDERRNWNKNWLEVATELCGVDDGLPAELDGFKLTKAGHRVERLKALGNAIVPQVAIEIFRAIKESENAKI